MERAENGYLVETDARTLLSVAAILGTGSSPGRLGIPGEEELTGRGVSYCAACDGPFFVGRDVIVVGGGDGAVDGALHPAEYASPVAIIHRRGRLRADPILEERAKKTKQIDFRWDSILAKILGRESVEGTVVKNLKSGEETTLDAQGVFVHIGRVPKTTFVEGLLELDSAGYGVTDDRQRTSQKDAFAARGARDRLCRQIVTAAGAGCAAAIGAEKHIARYEGRA
jgi:thioredoxin reductase (NADPH)